MFLVKFMGFHHLVTVDFNAQARFIRDLDPAVRNLERLLGQAFTTFLPDPVRIQGIVFTRYGSTDMDAHGKGNIEVVVGVAAPGIAEFVAHLGHTDGTIHGPEMGISKDNVDRLAFQGVTD